MKLTPDFEVYVECQLVKFLQPSGFSSPSEFSTYVLINYLLLL